MEASVIAITLFVKNNRIKLSLSQCGFRGCCSCHVPLPWAKSGVSLKVKAERKRVRLLPCWHHNAGKKGCQGRQIPNAGNLDRKSDATAPSASYAEAGKRSTRPENTLKIAMIPTMRTDCLRTRNLIHTGLLILADKLRMLVILSGSNYREHHGCVLCAVYAAKASRKNTSCNIELQDALGLHCSAAISSNVAETNRFDGEQDLVHTTCSAQSVTIIKFRFRFPPE